MLKKFFIKNEYIENPPYVSLGEDNYWTSSRIEASFDFQYPAYRYFFKLIKKESNILDIGCGSAVKLKHFHNKKLHNIYGIDSKDAIEYCKKKYDFGVWRETDLENPDVSFEIKFDYIILSDVIEHIVNAEKLLDYVYNLADKDTIIMISTVERDLLHGKKNFKPLNLSHIREWNLREFTTFLRYKKFDILKSKLMRPYKLSKRNYKKYFKRLFFTYIWSSEKSFNYNQVFILKKNLTNK